MSEYKITPEQEQKWREEFEKWFTKNQGEAYDSMWVFARDAYLAARAIDAQRIAELEAQLAAANSRIKVLDAANVQQAEEIEELTYKLAEIRAVVKAIPKIIADNCFGDSPSAENKVSLAAAHICVVNCEFDHYKETGMWLFGQTGTEEFTKLLAEERKKAVPEGFMVVSKSIFNIREWTTEMNRAWHRAIPDVEKAFQGLLSAAPQPEDKP